MGKSTCASMEALAALMRPSDHTIGWTVGPTYELSKRVFIRVVDVVHERFEHHIEAFEPREHRLVIRNLAGGHSELRGKSADNPDSLLGEGLDFLVVDEAARIDDRVWTEHLSQRLIDKNGWAAILSTPAGKKGWFYKLHSRGLKARDADVESWSSPSSANPNLRAAIIEAERALGPGNVCGPVRSEILRPWRRRM
ncbi:MAG: hypothetical protein IPK60_20785 [Sandaracinaceae bacterium]|nr:hypothetical protein [Sandaracinaceae bacterium]